MRINKTFVDGITLPCVPAGKTQAQAFYRDSAIPGFALRVTNTGAKSFIVEKRIDGKVKRITLGRYGNLTVEQARKQAAKILGKIASGENPIADKKDHEARAITLQVIFEDYLLCRKDLKPSTVRDYQRGITWAFSDWLTKPALNITKDMVETRHREMGQKSHARANNAFRVLRAVFNHGRNKYEDAAGVAIFGTNPVERLSQTRSWYRIRRRQTLLKPHQLKPWYLATLEIQAEVSRDYLHFLLFTGLRRSEASQLSWDQVDFKEKTFSIPVTKNGDPHTLPITPVLEKLLQRRRASTDGPYVFPSPSEAGYLTDPRYAMEKVTDLSGVEFTLHDLRRTFITIAESLDIPAYALKRLLNHKNPNDVTAGYIIFDVQRLRRPMEQISNYILNHIGSTDNVVYLASR